MGTAPLRCWALAFWCPFVNPVGFGYWHANSTRIGVSVQLAAAPADAGACAASRPSAGGVVPGRHSHTWPATSAKPPVCRRPTVRERVDAGWARLAGGDREAAWPGVPGGDLLGSPWTT